MTQRSTVGSETFERESRLADNFSKVPHGLWTCDLSHGAKCLLGWLHSHTSSYLSTLTVGRIRREFGSGGSVARWLSELEQAGYVLVIVEKNRHRYRLRAAPWDALATRSKSSGESSRNGTTRNGTTHNGQENDPEWADNRPEMGTIEDHVGDQGEEHSLAHASVSTTTPAEFDRFWSTYPRKVGKGAARNRWTRMSAGDRKAALGAVEHHAARWSRERTEVRFIPHPATWLGQQRWLDDLTTEARHEPTMPSAVRHAADLLARVRAQSSDHAAEERRLELSMSTEEEWL